MNQQLEKIRDIQKDAWNKSSAGWKKWDDFTMRFMKPTGDEMIRMLKIKEDDHVLDVATGTGEPGLTIASMLSTGKVVATDLAEGMLEVSRENALKRGIKNFETVCCDVSSLPFDNETFDAVSCRFGFMFFPDMLMSLNEMVRVLKPGGRISASVWAPPEKNFWICTSMRTMISMLQLTPPTSGAPGLFRCAEEGLLSGLFTQAGLINIEAKEVPGKLECGTLDNYWSFITEVASPKVFSQADETLKVLIRDEVLGKVRESYPSGFLALDACAIVVSAEK